MERQDAGSVNTSIGPGVHVEDLASACLVLQFKGLDRSIGLSYFELPVALLGCVGKSEGRPVGERRFGQCIGKRLYRNGLGSLDPKIPQARFDVKAIVASTI